LDVTTLLIEPGSPWENGYVESFIGKMRDELLNGEVLDTLEEAKVLVEAWRKAYNRIRPHSSLGDLPPRQFIDKYKSSIRSQKTLVLAGSVFG
jgi:transposase InsO family protein